MRDLPREDRQARRVLAIDDEPEILDLLTEILGEHGFRVATALSGEAGVGAYRAHQPDVVLLDLRMPGMDGLATLIEIRRLDPEARVAILTAMGTRAAVAEALAAGARDFVLKPFDPERVLATVKQLLAA